MLFLLETWMFLFVVVDTSRQFSLEAGVVPTGNPDVVLT